MPRGVYTRNSPRRIASVPTYDEVVQTIGATNKETILLLQRNRIAKTNEVCMNCGRKYSYLWKTSSARMAIRQLGYKHMDCIPNQNIVVIFNKTVFKNTRIIPSIVLKMA